MADSKANRFIQKMKTRDMRVAIRDDFQPAELDFDAEEMVRLIVEGQLPLDFVYDTMVSLLSHARQYSMSSMTHLSSKQLADTLAKSLLLAWRPIKALK